jgi:regulator of replication initiation timing
MNNWIIIGILITLMSGAAYFYYSTTQSRIAELIANNATLTANVQTITDANNQNIQTIDDLQASYQRVQEDFSRVQSEFQGIRLQNNELRERLGRHELDALASAKPALVERTVNNASANAMRCFELMSGAPLNEKELAATTSRQANSECPWIFDEIFAK